MGTTMTGARMNDWWWNWWSLMIDHGWTWSHLYCAFPSFMLGFNHSYCWCSYSSAVVWLMNGQLRTFNIFTTQGFCLWMVPNYATFRTKMVICSYPRQLTNAHSDILHTNQFCSHGIWISKNAIHGTMIVRRNQHTFWCNMLQMERTRDIDGNDSIADQFSGNKTVASAVSWLISRYWWSISGK